MQDGSREHAYWNNWYRSGGSSGEGSIGIQREWKWDIITKHLNPNSVIDYGCGDLSFWEGRTCKDYLGIDISEAIIASNQVKRPSWKFITADRVKAISEQKQAVFCLDVLFHVMNDALYVKILEDLCKLSSSYIFIYTWFINPLSRHHSIKTLRTELSSFRLATVKHTAYMTWVLGKRIILDQASDGKYETYRPFQQYTPSIEEKGFTLIELAKYGDGVGAMWIFKKGFMRKQEQQLYYYRNRGKLP